MSSIDMITPKIINHLNFFFYYFFSIISNTIPYILISFEYRWADVKILLVEDENIEPYFRINLISRRSDNLFKSKLQKSIPKTYRKIGVNL